MLCSYFTLSFLDKDLMKVSKHLDHLEDLAGFLGIPDDDFNEISSKFSKKNICGFHTLKKWKSTNPEGTKEELVQILEMLDLDEAIKWYVLVLSTLDIT